MVITLGNVFSTVDSCTKEEYLAFRECLTYVVPNHWFAPSFKSGMWDGKKRFFKNKTFPTGLLHIVLEVIPGTVVRQTRDSEVFTLNPNVLKNKSMTGKYAYQYEAVQTMLDRKRGIVYQATNAGKNTISSAFIETLNKPTLFLVHQKELMKQTYETFTEQTSLPIGIIGSGIDNRKFVTVGMVPTISRRLNNVEMLKWLSEIECVIVDECHLSGAKTFTKVLEACTGAKYRFGLSGTPLDRSEIDNISVMSQLGGIISEVRNQALIDLTVSSKPIITMYELPMTLNANNYPDAYMEGIVENVERNQIIVSLAQKLLTEKHTILILVKRVKHGTILKQMFSECGIEVAFCYGDSSDEEREVEISAIRNGTSNILILSKIGQVGLDIPSLSAGIRSGAGQSVIETLQGLGRYLRNPKEGENTVLMYDFMDLDGSYLEKHSERRKLAYEREQFEVTVESYSVENSV